jgi:hypothetical protein
LAAAFALAGVGCGSKITRRACMGGGAGDNPLLTGASLFRLDVYDPSAQCDGPLLGPGAAAPTMSRTFSAGDPIELDVPPGMHTLVLTSFADAAGSVVLGQGCTQAALDPGAQLCFDLAVAPVPDGAAIVGSGGDDGAMCGATDTVTNCGGCNNVCSSGGDNTARSCDGTKCSYTCADTPAPRRDCNADTSPNIDGCECEGTGCCDGTSDATYGSCQPTHVNGLGQSFYNCVPLGTYTMAEAQAAATAFDPTGAVDGMSNHYVTGKSSVDYICNQSTAKNSCPCWAWNGTGQYAAAIGHVDQHPVSGALSDNCFFPLDASFPSWN